MRSMAAAVPAPSSAARCTEEHDEGPRHVWPRAKFLKTPRFLTCNVATCMRRKKGRFATLPVRQRICKVLFFQAQGAGMVSLGVSPAKDSKIADMKAEHPPVQLWEASAGPRPLEAPGRPRSPCKALLEFLCVCAELLIQDPGDFKKTNLFY